MEPVAGPEEETPVRPPAPQLPSVDVSDRAWRIGAALIMLLAAALRYSFLNLAIFHMDEGVNGSFLIDLLHKGLYRYDPANYHGPTLYFFAEFVANHVFHGLSDAQCRFETATFSLATVAMVLSLQQVMGRRAALAAGLLLAVSPSSTYYARYFIHESLLVCFTLGMVVPFAYVSTLGRQGAMVLASASAGLMFATKETAIVHLGIILTGKVLADIYVYRTTGRKAAYLLLTPAQRIVTFLSGLSAFLIPYTLFYSSFYTNPQGVNDSLGAFAYWFITGKHEHVHPVWQHFAWLAREDLPILYLGLLGVLLVAATPRLRTSFNILAAFWAVMILAAYSSISYKTPWLSPNFVLPLSICGGITIDQVWRALSPRKAALLLTLACTVLFTQNILVSFIHYDEEDYAYPYARTRKQARHIVEWINEAAATLGTGLHSKISWCANEYWPLPWYIRDYDMIGWWAQPTFGGSVPDIVVYRCDDNEFRSNETEALKPLMGDRYIYMGQADLRDGVTLAVARRKTPAELQASGRH